MEAKVYHLRNRINLTLSPLSFTIVNKMCYQTCLIKCFIGLFVLSGKIDFSPYKTIFIVNNLSDNIF